MMSKKNACLLVFFIFIIGSFSFFSSTDRHFELIKNIEIYASLFKKINNFHIKEINPNLLMKQGIDSMLSTLDPYTNFMSSDMVEQARITRIEHYGGIGIAPQARKKKIVVKMIYEESPAATNGLSIGDEIIKVNGRDVTKMPVDEVNQIIHGQIDTEVCLTVNRMGISKPLSLCFKRKKISPKNITYANKLAHDIGYIHLSIFGSNAHLEIKEKIMQFKKEGMAGLILDLRNNPGGLLLEAVKICDFFLPDNVNVVSTKGKIKAYNISYKTSNPPLISTLPVAILLNKNSASASEIVAGALQDYDRAVLIGTPSFGKGLVQINRPLSYHAQLKMTTARYYTPTGRCIQAIHYEQSPQKSNEKSLASKKIFKTSHGRIVYDRLGIHPDIITKNIKTHSFVQMLEKKSFFFDYASLYASRNASIPEAKKFSLNDSTYQHFVQWMTTQPYVYVSASKQQLEKIKNTAEEEGTFESIRHSFSRLSKNLDEEEKKYFQRFRPTITHLLEKEISSRYYFKKGMIESTMSYDIDIQEAIEILTDSIAYHQLLNPL